VKNIFAEKVNTVKESYFSKKVTGDEEVQEEIVEDADQTVELSDVNGIAYLSTIRKTAPKV
jgi:hypothetical protein